MSGGDGIVKLSQKITHLCSKERTRESFGLSRTPLFRYSHPLSFPQGEGVWERFFINLTMPARELGGMPRREPRMNILTTRALAHRLERYGHAQARLTT